MRVLRGLLVAVVALATLGVVGAGAVVGSRDVADALVADVEEAFSAAGIRGVEVRAEGREVELVADGADAAMMTRAERLAASVQGVRSVDAGRADVATPDPEPEPTTPEPAFTPLSVSIAADAVQLNGSVPTQELADAIGARIATIEGKPVGTGLRVDPTIAEPAWWPRLAALMHDLSVVRDLRVDLVGGVVTVRGTTVSQAAADRVAARVAEFRLLPQSDVVLEVVPSLLAPFDAGTIEQARVVFPDVSAVIGPEQVAVLDQVADVLLRNVGVTVSVVGHAGTSPEERGNAISQARTRAVREYLVGAGVAPERLREVVAGPAVGATGSAGQYRRVDFRVEE